MHIDLLAYPAFIISLIIAITLHEFGHAFAADIQGDHTPSRQGRLTINPLKHLDIYGTLALFLVGIGWGKPVIVNPHHFKNGQYSELIVASMGIIINMALALIALFLLKFFALASWPKGASDFLFIFARLNLALFIFNLIPLYPLDGEKIIKSFMPLRYTHYFTRMESYGSLLLLGFIVMDNFLGIHIISSLYQHFVTRIFHLFGFT